MTGWLFVCLFATGLPKGTLIDRVVAVVDKQVITQSELLTEARITLAFQLGEGAASGDLDQDFLDTFVDYLVNQNLIAQQARRLGSGEVSEADIEREHKRLVTRFRSGDAFKAFLRRYDISDEVLQNTISRTLRNDRYINDRMRLRLLETDTVTAKASAKYKQALTRWLAELRAAAEIRLLGPSGDLELLRPAASDATGGTLP